jgi:hypothetical protein
VPSPDGVEPAFHLLRHLQGRCRIKFQFSQVAGYFGSLAVGVQDFAVQPRPARAFTPLLVAA